MKDRPAPALTGRAEVDRLARLEREAAALRANLRRRKEQQRVQPADETAPRSCAGNAPPDPLP